MKINTLIKLVIASLLLASQLVFAQDRMHAILFAEVESLLDKAQKVQAEVLSPENFEDAMESYNSAIRRMERGNSLDRIKKDIAEAKQYLKKAMAASELAEATFVTVKDARADALAAQAKKFAAEEWGVAEEQYGLAIKRLERGKLKGAQNAAKEAEMTYRAAELAAIKRNYLTDARVLIKKADKEKIERQAPITLNKAINLLEQAEKALSENRYDIDQPRSLARQAQYEAKHAFRIANLIRAISRKNTEENLILDLEEYIVRVASALDLTPKLDGSVEDPVQDILVKITDLQKKAYDLQEREQELAALETQMAEMEAKLGLQSERLAIQEANRKKLRKIESMFSEEEAQVMKKGNNILIRLVGLNFKSGSANIDSQYFDLLKKVEAGMAIYPGALVTVEGHTDSFGSDASNLALSRERAEAVKSYLLANISGRAGDSISAVGYGEARPIGNNENPQGREKNRRIDLVISVPGGL